MKYKYIVAYGRYFGSRNYYIRGQVERAEKENSPEDTISFHDGAIVTADNIPDRNLVNALDTIIKNGVYLPEEMLCPECEEDVSDGDCGCDDE